MSSSTQKSAYESSSGQAENNSRLSRQLQVKLISAPGICHTQDERVEVIKAIGKTCKAEQKEVLETLEKGGLVEHLSLERIERTEQAVQPRHPRRFRAREAAIKADVDEEEIREAGDVVWLRPDYKAASRQRR